MQNYKTPRKYIGENADDFGYEHAFLDTAPKTQSLKEIIDKLNFIKIKNFCSVKDKVKRMRRQATDWEKIFAKDTSDKGLLYKIYEEYLTIRKQTLLKNGAKDLNRQVIKEDIHMASKYMKRCSTSYVIREMQIKIMTYHYTPIRMAKIRGTDNTKRWRRCGATGILIHCWWEYKWYSHFGR